MGALGKGRLRIPAPARRRGNGGVALALTVLAGVAAAPAAQAQTSYDFDFAFGSQGTGPGQLSQPRGLAVDPSDGEVFVADTGNHRIQVFTPAGTLVRQWGSLGAGDGQFTNPAGLGVSPVAPFDVYVADTNDNRVEQFTNGGVFIRAFGASGSAGGQMQFPRGIAFDPQGNVYVADTGSNQRIDVFSPDGTFQRVVGRIASGFTQLSGLTNSVGATSDLYMTDAGQNTLIRSSFDGSTGTDYAQVLNNPQGVAVHTESNGSLAFIFVSDAGNHRVAIFGGGGPFLKSFGSLGTGEGQFTDPSGIAFSHQNNHVYVAEANDCCTRISAWKQVPNPQLGRSMDIEVDSGKVFYKPPGSKRFKRLRKVGLVPSGTIIDARRGTVGITSVTADGRLQSADFYKGIFKAIQKARKRGLTEAKLFGGDFNRCPRGLRAAKKNPQTIRRLWGRGAGRFRTQGRFAAAAIRGTTWLTDDRCDGTLIRVTDGSVTVRDLVKKKNFVVSAGQQYFARAPARRRTQTPSRPGTR